MIQTSQDQTQGKYSDRPQGTGLGQGGGVPERVGRPCGVQPLQQRAWLLTLGL